MKNFSQNLILTLVPLIFIALGTMFVQLFELKSCMGRIEERLANFITIVSSELKHRN